MTTTQDGMMAKLGPGQLNDLLLAFYKTGGASSSHISDAEYEFLLAKGVPAKQVQDMWYAFLYSLGFRGTISDMKNAWWTDGGLPSTDTMVLWTSSLTNSDGILYLDLRPGVGNYTAEKGHSWLGDGVAYGGIESPISPSNDFIMSFKFRLAGLTGFRSLIGGSAIDDGIVRVADATGNIEVWIDGVKLDFTSVSVSAITVYTLEVSRTGLDVTATLTDTAGAVQSQTIASGSLGSFLFTEIGARAGGTSDRFIGNLWDIHITDSTGVIFSNFLAQDSTDMKMISEVGPDVQFVNGTYPIVEKSVLYGHEWSNYSEGIIEPELWDDDEAEFGASHYSFDGEYYTKLLTSTSEVQVQDKLEEGQIYQYEVEILSGTWRLQLGGPPITNNLAVLEVGVHIGVLPAESTGLANSIRFRDPDSGGIGKLISLKKIIVGKIPADPSTLGLDVLGNPLTNPGLGRNDMGVTGHTGTFDGVAHGELVYPTDIDGSNMALDFSFSLNDGSVGQGIIGTDVLGDFLRVNTGGIVQFRLNGVGPTFDDIPTVTGLNTGYLEVSGGTVTLTLNGESQTKGAGSGTWVCDRLCRAVTTELKGALHYLKVYEAGVLVHHWVCESDPTSLQDTIYDIVGGNHAVLTDATLPFFTTEMSGSKLFADGFAEDSVFGDELWDDPSVDTVDGSNFSTYDPETGICQIVSDGTYIDLLVSGGLSIGKSYALSFTELAKTGASVALALPPIPLEGTTSFNFVATHADLAIRRGGACDVTFKLSVKEVAIGLVPARADGRSALGQPLTNPPGKLSGSHCLLAANESVSMYGLAVLAGVEADLYLAEVAIGLTPDEWVALIVGGNLNDALMLSITKNLIVGWNPALTGSDLTDAENFLGV